MLFFPDQHLGRNTGYAMGFTEDDMRVWNPRHELGGLTEADVKEATFLLWKGHCSVHQRFRPSTSRRSGPSTPTASWSSHPECAHDVCELADQVGSTDYIIKAVEAAPPGSAIGVGTEIHLVQPAGRRRHPDKTSCRSTRWCARARRCSASTRRTWRGSLENLVEGRVVNRITVDADTAEWARVALERMLDIT